MGPYLIPASLRQYRHLQCRYFSGKCSTDSYKLQEHTWLKMPHNQAVIPCTDYREEEDTEKGLTQDNVEQK